LNEQILKLDRVSTADCVTSEIAHDIKNYLSSLSGYFEMLQINFDDGFRLQHDRYIRMIEQSFSGLKDYIEELMSSKSQSPALTDCNLLEIVRIMAKFLTPQRRFRDVSLKIKSDPDFPKSLRLDEAQIHRVLLNLLINAADALATVDDDRPKEITVELHHDPQQERAIVVVADNGSGISEEVRRGLFTKSITTKEKGHGIGLMNVKKIISGYGGSIHVESKLGEGSKFIITLPVGQADDA
jgi:two-component system, sporulation sensor kinase D